MNETHPVTTSTGPHVQGSYHGWLVGATLFMLSGIGIAILVMSFAGRSVAISQDWQVGRRIELAATTTADVIAEQIWDDFCLGAGSNKTLSAFRRSLEIDDSPLARPLIEGALVSLLPVGSGSLFAAGQDPRWDGTTISASTIERSDGPFHTELTIRVTASVGLGRRGQSKTIEQSYWIGRPWNETANRAIWVTEMIASRGQTLIETSVGDRATQISIADALQGSPRSTMAGASCIHRGVMTPNAGETRLLRESAVPCLAYAGDLCQQGDGRQAEIIEFAGPSKLPMPSSALGLLAGGNLQMVSMESSADKGAPVPYIEGRSESHLVAFGSANRPIEMEGLVLVEGDLILAGELVGAGTLWVNGDVYLPSSLRHVAEHAEQLGPSVAVIANGDIVLGSTPDWAENRLGSLLDSIKGDESQRGNLEFHGLLIANESITARPNRADENVDVRIRGALIANVLDCRNVRDLVIDFDSRQLHRFRFWAAEGDITMSLGTWRSCSFEPAAMVAQARLLR